MTHTLLALILITTICFIFPSLSVSAVTPGSTGASFLITAVQGNLVEITLGQLALQKAESPEVKQFAARMIQDHQRASQAVQALATKEELEIPEQGSEKQKAKHHELAQLTGRAFDRAYMQYMLGDHQKGIQEFEQNAQRLPEKHLQRWALETLPLLKQHHALATSVATSLGLTNPSTEEPTPVAK